ncbi:NAD(P)/FAD-dependent oxidoreductase [Halopseudomonas oceani]|uniref:flavin-containing monooxygenase n=1 Tax=Halopseudomonas oceani TaxID=1708783 RepID=UPI002AA79C2B|nr:NAD(P)/FAD-dependent oxidoreductase [Halopseudomonas oceani]
MSTQHFDVLIAGAGLSGIGTACHIQRAFPDKKLVLLERRQNLGGTWDLFRYPGIRSDSDMFSFGYAFRPWNELKVLADGPSIRQYIADTAKQYKVDEKIQYGLKILSAEWSSEHRLWTLEAEEEATGAKRRFTCDFFISCTGYYNHDAGFLPTFPGEERYQGLRIHPQHWPEDLDYSGKTVLVIGSGATAVTLVPAMADKAAHVTMLQRSPSYIFSVPGLDKMSAVLQRFLPEKWVYNFARSRNIRIQRWLYEACRRWPKTMRRFLLWRTRSQLGKDFDMTHFTPKYMPWDERLCAVPDGDLFKALRNGKASVETDHIETFTETGIRLKSGKQLDADIIISATGLNLQMLGGIQLRIDGKPRQLSDSMTYKGLLLQNVPNMAWIFGYTNAPWTLKSDLSGQYLCRLFSHMQERNLDVVMPRDVEGCTTGGGVLDSLASGYVQRAKDLLPRQGSKLPWKVMMHFERDSQMLLEEPIEDGILQFELAREEHVTPLRRSA